MRTPVRPHGHKGHRRRLCINQYSKLTNGSISNISSRDATPHISSGRTDSLAVGRRGFLDQVQPLIFSRRETEIVEDQELGLWVLKETEITYGSELRSKTNANSHSAVC